MVRKQNEIKTENESHKFEYFPGYQITKLDLIILVERTKAGMDG